jgi:hypothetical protein
METIVHTHNRVSKVSCKRRNFLFVCDKGVVQFKGKAIRELVQMAKFIQAFIKLSLSH